MWLALLVAVSVFGASPDVQDCEQRLFQASLILNAVDTLSSRPHPVPNQCRLLRMALYDLLATEPFTDCLTVWDRHTMIAGMLQANDRLARACDLRP